MSLDRSGTYSKANPPPNDADTAGANFLEQYGAFVDALIDTAVLRLTSVAGTDTITASADPFTVPSSGLVTGMKFTLVPVNNNTGAATLNIDARGAKAILNADGSALSADDLVDGTRYLIEYDGTDFIIIGAVGGAGATAASRTVYDTTTVWDNTLPASALVMVELWGAGGGGSTGAGGGGASYAVALYKAGDLPSSVTITVPAGGAGGSTGVTGGNCTFGSLLTAYGGGRGTGTGGGGGGESEVGSESGPAGRVGGGAGGTSGTSALTVHGGAGGGTSGAGGWAVYGGGGGSGTGTGGTSKYGGNGGSGIEAGQRPGGGGGRTSNGGGGRAIVTVFGG